MSEAANRTIIARFNALLSAARAVVDGEGETGDSSAALMRHLEAQLAEAFKEISELPPLEEEPTAGDILLRAEVIAAMVASGRGRQKGKRRK